MNLRLDKYVGETVIAILEDDPTTRDMFQQALELSQLASRAFRDPEACIKACLESRDINFLLTDLHLGLPKLGTDVIRSVRVERPMFKAILVSACSIEQIESARGDLMDVPFMRKPFSLRTLLDTINELLRQPPTPHLSKFVPYAQPQKC